jgi:hypothetical protein
MSRRVVLFAEDEGHRLVLSALIRRLAAESGADLKLDPPDALGGRGQALNELSDYVRELDRTRIGVPDLLVPAIDANCSGYAAMRQAVQQQTAPFEALCIPAIADPHIERWLLLDSKAFRRVVGKGCKAPDQKCQKDRYKELLSAAVREAGAVPVLGGIELAGDLVAHWDLEMLLTRDASLGAVIRDLRTRFSQWAQTAPPDG